ncbi:MAG: CAP domain-containing protein [Alphaproteobacteria bacterium]
MSDASALEQYMLELINAERAAVGAQPLAFNGNLNDAAEDHTVWMLATDTFSHTGQGGSSAGQRMQAAGYVFSGSWAWGENIAWQSTRGAAGYADDVANLHDSLMNSAGHRANILNTTYREIGVGVEVGEFSGWNAAMVTENFAKSGTAVFLTGVAFDDKDGDILYDAGEGLGGVTVDIVGSGGQHLQTTTQAAGGYQIALANGSYTVTFSAPGLESETRQVSINGSNVKLDYADPDPAGGGGGTVFGSEAKDIWYGALDDDIYFALGGNDTAKGRDGNDTIDGGAGRDYLVGHDGNDLLMGGADNDRLYGGAGNDILRGGGGNDYLRGDEGHDILQGEAGNDQLRGYAGNDTLIGGDGRDVMLGGTGADLFGNGGSDGLYDRVSDYSAAQGDAIIDGASYVFSGTNTYVYNAAGDLIMRLDRYDADSDGINYA